MRPPSLFVMFGCGALLLTTSLGWSAPPAVVGELRFGEVGRGIGIAVDRGIITEVEGRRCWVLGRQESRLEEVWGENLPKPGLPGATVVVGSEKKTDLSSEVRMTIPAPGRYSLVATLWDESRSPTGQNLVALGTVDKGRFVQFGALKVAGCPGSSEPIFRPTFRPSVVLIPESLTKAAGEIAVVFDPRTEVAIADLRLVALLPVLEASTPESIGALKARFGRDVTVLDLWHEAMVDLVKRQAWVFAETGRALGDLNVLARHAKVAGAAGLPDPSAERAAILSKVAAVVSSFDRFFYEARLAWVLGDSAKAHALRDDVAKQLEALSFASSRVTSATASALKNLPPTTLTAQRPPDSIPPTLDDASSCLMIGFRNSTWKGMDPFGALPEIYRAIGIEGFLSLIGPPSLQESGEFEPAEAENRFGVLQEVGQAGSQMLYGVGHHMFPLTNQGGLPKWVQNLPGVETVEKGESARAYNVYDPQIRGYVNKVIEKLAATWKGKPNFVPWYYWGEPKMTAGAGPAALAAFHAYLRESYSNIDELNKDWRTDYASFDAIQPPVRDDYLNPSPLFYWFETFRRHSLVALTAGYRESLRRGDAGARLWFEGWGRYDYLVKHAMNQYQIAFVSDIFAVHTSLAQEVMRPLQEAISRYSGKPFADGEITVGGVEYNGANTQWQVADYGGMNVKAQLWSGARIITFWPTFMTAFSNSYGGPRFYEDHFNGPLSPVATAIAQSARFSRDILPVIESAPLVPHRVGVLYSSTSFLGGRPLNQVEHETMPVHSWLHYSKFGYDLVMEEALADGRETLENYDLLVVPWGLWLGNAAQDALAKFVRRGGTIVAAGPPGAFNAYGFPSGRLLREFAPDAMVEPGLGEWSECARLDAASRSRMKLGDSPAAGSLGGWKLKMSGLPKNQAILFSETGEPVAWSLPGGEAGGRLILANGSLWQNALRELAVEPARARCLEAIAYSSNPDRVRVSARRTSDGTLFLGVFNLDAHRSSSETISVAGTFSATDEFFGGRRLPIASSIEAGRTLVKLTLQPGEGMVLQLDPPRKSSSASPGQQKPETAESTIVASGIRGQVAARYQALDKPALSELVAKSSLTPSPRETVRTLAVAEAGRMPDLFVLDGDASDWSEAKFQKLNLPGGATGTVGFGWNERDLLIMVRVTGLPADKPLLDPEVHWMWIMDGIRLRIDALPDTGVFANVNYHDLRYGPAETFLAISREGKVTSINGYDFPVGAVHTRSHQLPDGYTMEIQIPLGALFLDPKTIREVPMAFELTTFGRGTSWHPFGSRESLMNGPVYLGMLRFNSK